MNRLIDPIHHNNNHYINQSYKNALASSFNVIKSEGGGSGADGMVLNVAGSSVREQLHKIEWNKCSVLKQTKTDITTLDEYGKFDFQVITNNNI